MLFSLLCGHILEGVLLTGHQLLPDSREGVMPLKQGAPHALFMCFSASEYHFFFMRLSCQDWFCMYQLLGNVDWIIAVDYDFLRIFFNCKGLGKPACVDSCVTAAIFGKFSILLGGLFKDKLIPATGRGTKYVATLHIVTRTRSEWHRIKVCM